MAKIPIAAAKRIARAYNLDEVIIIGVDRKNCQRFHATYGKDIWHCEDAANASRVFDLALSSNTPEEFILKAKGIFKRSDNHIAHGEHAVMEQKKVIITPDSDDPPNSSDLIR